MSTAVHKAMAKYFTNNYLETFSDGYSMSLRESDIGLFDFDHITH